MMNSESGSANCFIFWQWILFLKNLFCVSLFLHIISNIWFNVRKHYSLMKIIFTAENGLTSSSVRLIRWRIESIWSQVELSLDFVVARVIFSEEDTSIYFKGRILFCVYCVCALQVCCRKNNGITNTRFRIVITLFRVSQVALVKNLCGFDPWVGKTPLRRK